MSKRIYEAAKPKEESLIPATSQTPVHAPAKAGTTVAVDSDYMLAIRSAYKDRLRGALAKQIMDNTAALANAETHYLKMVPGGAAEYRKIVETYTNLALLKLAGGEL